MGRSKTSYARQAILTHLDELEDTYLALRRLKRQRSAGSLKNWKRVLTWSVEWDDRARRE